MIFPKLKHFPLGGERQRGMPRRVRKLMHLKAWASVPFPKVMKAVTVALEMLRSNHLQTEQEAAWAWLLEMSTGPGGNVGDGAAFESHYSKIP